MKVSGLSVEYVRVEVSATDSGAPVNPTGTPPEFAFMPYEADADPSSWETGDWETVTNGSTNTYYARCVLGAGALDLAVGDYWVWLRLTNAPEVPVRKVGTVAVV